MAVLDPSLCTHVYTHVHVVHTALMLCVTMLNLKCNIIIVENAIEMILAKLYLNKNTWISQCELI